MSKGQVAYEAYCESAGWMSKHTGSQLPQWSDVDDDVKVHWEESATAVVLSYLKERGRQ